ncbi:MAG: hypothetical protein DRO88_06560 [Promethearchaeia archaeon]|nr:MAG: hypothetical protein DRO88_06560 [Candidatus Lokiarchaeia archaeon]
MESPKVRIAFIGRAGSGKNTIRKIFFDKVNPLNVLKQAFEQKKKAVKQKKVKQKNDVETELLVCNLPGPNLSQWFDEDSCLLDNIDVVFLILEATDEWYENLDVIRQFDENVRKHHINASIGILLHKIDLLTVQKLNDLKRNLQEVRKESRINIDFFTTSNQPQFINETIFAILRTLVSVYKNNENFDFYDLFIETELMRHFKKPKKPDYDELKHRLRIQPIEIVGFFNILIRDGILVKENNQKITKLSEKGLQIINFIDTTYISKLKDTLLTEKNYVKGFILANLKGIILFSYESTPNFFDSLVSKTNSESNQEQISKYFAKTVQFGEKMDYNGLDSFFLSGKNTRIIARVYHELIGIYIIDRVDMDKGLWIRFYDFLKRFHEANYKVIEDNILKGEFITDPEIIKQLEQKIQFFDMIIKSHYQSRSKISFNKILDLYKNLLKEEKFEVSVGDLKNILYQYLLCENPDSLDEI